MDFPATLAYLEAMLDYIKAEVAALGSTKEQLRKIELASEEAIVNIISYAFEDKEGIITILCQSERDHFIEVIIKDLGPPFDPLRASFEVDVNLPLEERKIGGLGIFLIDKMTDKATYERVGEENRLHLFIQKHNAR